jgi:hypothetical protein
MTNINILREKILLDNYELTGHAFEEAKEDGLSVFDIESAILYGKIIKTLSGDPRGKRYIVEGQSLSKKLMHAVCRILPSGKLRIITVYSL